MTAVRRNNCCSLFIDGVVVASVSNLLLQHVYLYIDCDVASTIRLMPRSGEPVALLQRVHWL